MRQTASDWIYVLYELSYECTDKYRIISHRIVANACVSQFEPKMASGVIEILIEMESNNIY